MNHSFDIDVAVKYGVNEAILIENMRFWIAKNKANNRHFYEGRYWTYNSIKAYSELFPYWTSNQVRRIIQGLVSQGVIIVGNHNSNPYDRTQWYALNEQMHLADLPNGNAKNAKSSNSTDINTDIKADDATADAVPPIGFDGFWNIYPKKVAKKQAIKAWKSAKMKSSEHQSILDDIEKRIDTDEWKKNNGQFIPNPATYLNNRRWEDEEVSFGKQWNDGGMIPGAI